MSLSKRALGATCIRSFLHSSSSLPGTGRRLEWTQPLTLTLTARSSQSRKELVMHPGGQCWLLRNLFPGSPKALGSLELILKKDT